MALLTLFVLLLAIPASAGAPLPGLTAEQQERFRRGQTEFERVMRTRWWGQIIGPEMQYSTECSGCHNHPDVGGSAKHLHRRVQHWARLGDGSIQFMPNRSLERRLPGDPLAVIHAPQRPRDIVEISRRIPPPLYGLGLVEAVKDEEILAEAALQGKQGHVAGVIPLLEDGRVAKFGYQGLAATIREMVILADELEMGVTSDENHFLETDCIERIMASTRWDHLGRENVIAERCNPMGPSRADRLTDFLRFLAPLPPREQKRFYTKKGARGAVLFAEIGCTDCHRPTWNVDGPTGHAQFIAYSDFLCHDLGASTPTLSNGACPPGTIRTARLSGLSLRRRRLHDGSVEDAYDVEFSHGGEAEEHRQRWSGLFEYEFNDIEAFLRQPETFADIVQGTPRME